MEDLAVTFSPILGGGCVIRAAGEGVGFLGLFARAIVDAEQELGEELRPSCLLRVEVPLGVKVSERLVVRKYLDGVFGAKEVVPPCPETLDNRK